VRVNDRGDFDGQLWIAMDYVEGIDAARLIRDRYPAGMQADEVAAIVNAIASALDYAGTQHRILLSDFGIAHQIGEASGLTATNMTVGTVAYSAPEQLMGLDDIDGRADQYALAATAYHLLTGSQLFPHSNPAVVISRHLNSAPPALADTRPELAALDPILAAALAKDPTDRFARCSDFARALAEQSPTHSSPAAAAPTARAPAGRQIAASRPKEEGHAAPASQHAAKRSRRLWLMAAAATVLVLAAAATLVWRPSSKNQSASATTSSAPPLAVPSTNSPSAPPPPPPPGSTQSASATSVVLPDVPPSNSGCEGTVTAHHDVKHNSLGVVRMFLFLNTSAQSDSEGCIAAVASSGKVLPAIPVDHDQKATND
jgi:serine/threonine-protein kinase